MYQVDLQTSIDPIIYSRRMICCETLVEAEVIALKLAIKRFGVGRLVMVHRGDLSYDIFEVTKPIARLRIKSVG